MHPSKVHTTMAAPSSGLRLGFTDIRPSEKKGSPLPSGLTQVTPSKGSAMPSSPFTFTFTRQGTAADLGLSTRAQEMMNELREEAAKIKAELAAQRELEKAEEEANGGRRIAKPKGKSSRFSAVHMAEFKKMDSIENHPSAFRALRNQLTPVAGIKRTSSRANLDELASPITQRSGIKRTQSKARLDEPDTPRYRKTTTAGSPIKSRLPVDSNPPTPAKRFKQRLEDDASSSRPSSRDGSSIPRPKSSGVDAAGGSLARSHSSANLAASAQKMSMARAAARGPTISLVRSPSKPDLSSPQKSLAPTALPPGAATPTRRILSPGRFERVKSILRGTKSNIEKPGSAIPVPAGASRTPNPPRVDKALPPVPACATSPRRKLSKRLIATPTAKETIKLQNSPSPLPSSNIFKFRAKSSQSSRSEAPRFASVDAVVSGAAKGAGEVAYPDLSKFGTTSPAVNADGKAGSMPPPSVPGTFSFRSDHTISFGSVSPTGFGGCAGQSSLRHVRPSILPMPGGFPSSVMDTGSKLVGGGANKENKSPTKFVLPGISHGMKNKKRLRVSCDEEDAEREAAERAAKRKKNDHVPQGDALLAPRLVGKTPTSVKKAQISRTPGSQVLSRDSPIKRKPGISLSRLKMLSQPKTRT